MIRKALALAIAGATLATGSGVAIADNNSKNPEVKYRHEVMEAMGKHFAAMALIFTNRVNRPDQLQVHADALARTATVIPTLFPEGSEGGHALPLIWDESEQEKLAEAAQLAVDTSAALASAAATGDKASIGKAFKAASDSCKGCHERYKEEDES